MVTAKKKVLIVDDHPIFCLGMSEVINQADDLFVCGSVDTAHKALSAIESLQPDFIIVDITLKESNGIELIKDIKRQFEGIPVLVVSMHAESLYAERALAVGAKGYIMKQEAVQSVVSAIRLVLDGKIYASEEIKDAILNKVVDPRARSGQSPIDLLTDRELEVLQLIGQGTNTRDIAAHLNLSISTIGTYRERLKEKLKLKHATELTSYAAFWMKNR